MKVYNTQICFREIPDEVTLAINISGCPIHCPGCHSKWLWEDVGEELTEQKLDEIIKSEPMFTCLCFMGGSQDIKRTFELNKYVRQNYPELKTAWYTGYDWSDIDFRNYSFRISEFDYVKTGPYIEERGPLNSPTTNQTMWKRMPAGHMKNITSEFYSREY